jgi:hypothetical protein
MPKGPEVRDQTPRLRQAYNVAGRSQPSSRTVRSKLFLLSLVSDSSILDEWQSLFSSAAAWLVDRSLRTWGAGTMSILAHEHPKELVGKLEAAGARCDFREPNSLPAVAGHPRRADTAFMTRSMTFGGSRRFWLSIRTSPRATYQIRLWRLSFVQAISAGSIGID